MSKDKDSTPTPTQNLMHESNPARPPSVQDSTGLTAWHTAKRFLSKPLVRLGLFALSIKPAAKAAYNLIDAYGNMQTAVEISKYVLKFLNTGWGTIALTFSGLGLIAWQLFKQERRAQQNAAALPTIDTAAPMEQAECLDVWLHDIAVYDKRRIQQLIIVENCEPVKFNLESENAPFIEFWITVFNASVYTVHVLDTVTGRIWYREHEYPLSGELRILENQARTLEHTQREIFKLRQWISPNECDLIRKFTKEQPQNPYYTKVDLQNVRVEFTVDFIDGRTQNFRLKLPAKAELPIAEPIDLYARIKELEQEKAALESSKTADGAALEQHETEIGRLQHLAETHSVRASMNESLLKTFKTQYGWLHEMADKQAKDIGSYVVVEYIRFCYHEVAAPIPYVIFGVDIHNKSVFDIVIENAIDGHIEIAGERLLSEKELIYNPTIPPCGKESLTLKQRLTSAEDGLVTRCEKETLGAFFYFDKLVIMIAGRTQLPQFERVQLKLPKSISSKDAPLTTLSLQHEKTVSGLETEIASLKTQLEERDQYKLVIELSQGRHDNQVRGFHHKDERNVPEGVLESNEYLISVSLKNLRFVNNDVARLTVRERSVSLIQVTRNEQETEQVVATDPMPIVIKMEDEGWIGQGDILSVVERTMPRASLLSTLELRPEIGLNLNQDFFLRVTFLVIGQHAAQHLDFDVDWEQVRQGAGRYHDITPRT